jgi:hypothetical protein
MEAFLAAFTSTDKFIWGLNKLLKTLFFKMKSSQVLRGGGGNHILYQHLF